ncbi:MAG TPA: hypothetical protein DD413_08220 [Ruminococcus sp.]|nr:hypothetical protein [Ruminococcus sp.]
MVQDVIFFKPESVDCKTYRQLKTYTLSKETHEKLKTLSISPPYIIIRDTNKIGKLIKDGENHSLKVFMTYAEVVQRIINADDGTATVKIRYFNGVEIREDAFSSDIFTKFGVKELLTKGIRFDEADSVLVIDYLLKSEAQAEVVYGYTKHGWKNIEQQLLFLGNEPLGNKKLKSKFSCQDSLDLTPTGNLEIWSEMVKNEVVGNLPMEFVLCASLSSVLLAMLNLSFDFGSIVINLANTSSKGKTTAAMLAASVFSNPQLNRGTAISYNATENSLQEFIARCNGLTVVLDEAAVCNTQNLQKLLYSIALGRSKMRLNGDSTQKEVKEFSSVIFSTAEFNFIEDESLVGIRTRVFEITDTLTKSAENSDNIKRTVIKNYAVAGNVFIVHLISKGKDKIEADYEQTKQELFEKYKISQKNYENHNLTERIISKLAIILQAAKYSNEVFDFSISIETMTSYLFTIVNRIVDIPSPEDEILTIVYEDVLQNFKKYRCSYSFLINTFDREELEQLNTSLFKSGYVGLIRNSNDEDYFEICVAQYHFKKLMQSHKIDDFRKRLKNLRAEGRLVAQKDRQISKVCILKDMPKVNAYVFRFKTENEDKLKGSIIKGYEPELTDDNLIKDDEEVDISSILDDVL